MKVKCLLLCLLLLLSIAMPCLAYDLQPLPERMPTALLDADISSLEIGDEKGYTFEEVFAALDRLLQDDAYANAPLADTPFLYYDYIAASIAEGQGLLMPEGSTVQETLEFIDLLARVRAAEDEFILENGLDPERSYPFVVTRPHEENPDLQLSGSLRAR